MFLLTSTKFKQAWANSSQLEVFKLDQNPDLSVVTLTLTTITVVCF